MAEDDKIRKAADSAVLMLSSRISGPVLVAICGWMLTSMLGMKTDIATVIAKLGGHDNELAQIQSRLNTLDMFAIGAHDAKPN